MELAGSRPSRVRANVLSGCRAFRVVDRPVEELDRRIGVDQFGDVQAGCEDRYLGRIARSRRSTVVRKGCDLQEPDPSGEHS